jgi:3-oxoacyl-[acyl-carrier protein] reductase
MKLNDLDFTGKVALVVGGSTGIGNAIAQGIRIRGGSVYVTGTRQSVADYSGEATSDLEGLHYSRLDVSTDAAIDDWAPMLERLDILVLSQGAVLYKRKEFDPAGFRQVVDVNLNSLMTLALKFHDALAATGGSLITISSVGAFRTTRGNPAYAASKAGAVHLTRTLADAWAADGIRVNGVAPGLVETKMTAVTTTNPERLAGRLAGIPL